MFCDVFRSRTVKLKIKNAECALAASTSSLVTRAIRFALLDVALRPIFNSIKFRRCEAAASQATSDKLDVGRCLALLPGREAAASESRKTLSR